MDPFPFHALYIFMTLSHLLIYSEWFACLHGSWLRWSV